MKSIAISSLTVFVCSTALAQAQPEPFLQLEVNRECATLDEDSQLLDAIELRLPSAFVVRGAVDGVVPDWRVTWRPTGPDSCELAFESKDNSSSMNLGPHPGLDEINLAASRVAWLSSVSAPRTDPEPPPEVPSEPQPQPEAEPKPPTEPTKEPAKEPAPKPEPETPAEPAPPTEPASSPEAANVAFTRVSTKVSVLPTLVLVPVPLPERPVPSFSFNAIGGRDFGLDGVQLGVVWNQVETFATGAQIAMGANIVGGDADLVQVALGGNIARRSMAGVQFGLFNHVGEGLRGAQVGVVSNARLLDFGLQTSVANIAGDGRGAQFGVINLGHDIRGLQLGVVNIAHTADVALGLINVMHGEPLYFDASIGHTGGVQMALRHGSKYVQWTYLVGYEPLLSMPSWRAGLGLGLHLPFEQLFIDFDVLGAAVVPVGAPAFKVSQLVQARLSIGWRLARRFAIFAGADGKALITGLSDGGELAPGFAANPTAVTDPTQVYLWPELHAGVRF